MYVRVFAIAAAVVAALTCAASARAQAGLLVGVDDDMFKLESGVAGSFAHDLGLQAARVSLTWHTDEATLGPGDEAELDQAVSTGLRVVVSVYGSPHDAPLDQPARDTYCGYVRDMLQRVPQVKDVVIWNEPNLSLFWQPQFDAGGSSAAPAAYEQLLATCWDVLHAAIPSVNVIAPSLCPWGSDSPTGPLTVSHSPLTFIQDLGAAYRASGRTTPIFDTVGHHIYGVSPGERPWRDHPYSPRRFSEGDLGKLIEVLQDAFRGTGQPVPGIPASARTASIWYLEAGYETTAPPDKQYLYWGQENAAVIPDSTGALPWTTLPDPSSVAPDQATQLRDALDLAYCQPYVGGFFNFLLKDQQDLGLWQSGVLWADRTPKASYNAFRDAIRAVDAHAVDCSQFPQTQVPATATAASVPIPPAAGAATAAGRPAARSLRLRWVRQPKRRYAKRNITWRLAVRATGQARFAAAVFGPHGKRRLAVRGKLAAGKVTPIRFPRRHLRGGHYHAVVTVVGSPATRLRSRTFVVR